MPGCSAVACWGGGLPHSGRCRLRPTGVGLPARGTDHEPPLCGVPHGHRFPACFARRIAGPAPDGGVAARPALCR
ncbi:hypothetical protein G6F32_017558 [Rhizopus arrhizus]|nr:hypothetical protein G6F32_017558 [Rhizopus arrhizus]